MARPAPSATRSAELLSLLAAHPDESFSLAELSRRLDASLGSTHALVHALAEVGYMRRSPTDKTWSIGPALVAVGEAATRRYPLVGEARDALHDVAGRHRLGGLVTSLQNLSLQILHAVGTRSDKRTTVGQRLPAVPPVGAIHLAAAGPETQARWLEQAAPEHKDCYRRLLGETAATGWVVRFGQQYQPALRESLAQLQDEPHDPATGPALRRAVSSLADPSSVATRIDGRANYDVVNVAVLARREPDQPGIGLYLVDFPPITKGSHLRRIIDDLVAVCGEVSGTEHGATR